MELPPPLRRAVDRALHGASAKAIAAAAEALSRRYREDTRDGRLHVATEAAALAYLAVRLPATFAAVHASLAAAALSRPDFAPRTMLDVGAGPGTALWAAAQLWPDLNDVLLVEASPSLRAWAEPLTAEAGPSRIVWRMADVSRDAIECQPRDLVTLAYVLGELSPAVRDTVVVGLWRLTADMLVIVEPGTPAGWQRMLLARTRLLAAGAHLVAPCPHANACPLAPPDWCHFAQRVSRSRIHRTVKRGDVPWEDEKFIYLAVSRRPGAPFGARVVARPNKQSGRIRLKLCQPDGTVDYRLFTRRDGTAFKQARRADWGTSMPP
jgi:ribosomal protein RSM22 (predicted rRNA methylase)